MIIGPYFPPTMGGTLFFSVPPIAKSVPLTFHMEICLSPPLGSVSPPDPPDVGGTRNYVPPTMGGMLQNLDQIPHGEWGGQAKNTWCPPHHAGDGFNFGVPPTLGGTESQISARSGGDREKYPPHHGGDIPPKLPPHDFEIRAPWGGTEESVSPPPWGG